MGYSAIHDMGFSL